MFSHLSKLAFCVRAEIEHVIATIFQLSERSEISAPAETHHVTRLLKRLWDSNYYQNDLQCLKKSLTIFLHLARGSKIFRCSWKLLDVMMQSTKFSFPHFFDLLWIFCWHVQQKINEGRNRNIGKKSLFLEVHSALYADIAQLNNIAHVCKPQFVIQRIFSRSLESNFILQYSRFLHDEKYSHFAVG